MNPAFRISAGLALLATGVAAVARLVYTYEHGIWLVAYLFLVGSLSQYLLARGQSALSPETPARVVRSETLFWSAGVVTVPLGVLGGMKILIVIGSLVLLAALVLFWSATRPGMEVALAAGRIGLVRGYRALLILVGISVFVGIGLGWRAPWFG